MKTIYKQIITLFVFSFVFSAQIETNSFSILYGDNLIKLSPLNDLNSRSSFEQKEYKTDNYTIKKRSHKRRRKIRRPREGR